MKRPARRLAGGFTGVETCGAFPRRVYRQRDYFVGKETSAPFTRRMAVDDTSASFTRRTRRQRDQRGVYQSSSPVERLARACFLFFSFLFFSFLFFCGLHDTSDYPARVSNVLGREHIYEHWWAALTFAHRWYFFLLWVDAVSNPRPLACESDAVTTRPRRHDLYWANLRVRTY